MMCGVKGLNPVMATKLEIANWCANWFYSELVWLKGLYRTYIEDDMVNHNNRREDLHTHWCMGLLTVLHTKSTYTICTVPGSYLPIRGSCLFV